MLAFSRLRGSLICLYSFIHCPFRILDIRNVGIMLRIYENRRACQVKRRDFGKVDHFLRGPRSSYAGGCFSARTPKSTGSAELCARNEVILAGWRRMDRISAERRSANMAAIRGKDTAPERAVRSVLRNLGVGYRLHVRGLPGRPDIVMKGRRKVIFVHGCFWHRHEGCRFAYQPKSRAAFWADKFARTVARDLRSVAALAADGWDVLIIWECESHDTMVLRKRIISFLGRDSDERTGQWGARTACNSEKARPSGRRRAAAGP
ncbi:MAG: very short patch repair endonuclease [Beijerinckiaceae bacterium]